jgi:NarL family two-component system sensor histidine kinase YdfH
MKSNRKFKTTVKNIFIPHEEGMLEAFREITPFLILTTMAVGGLFFFDLRVSNLLETPFRFFISTVLVLAHLIAYWSLLHFSLSERRKILFVILQGTLAWLVVISSNSVVMMIGIYCSLVGTLVGFLGRTRLTSVSLVSILALAGLNYLLIGGPQQLLGWLPAFLVGISVAIFFAYFLNRQIEAREHAQTLLEDLKKAHLQLSEYALEVEDLTLANERQRMARELHDTLAQGLAGLILQLEAVDTYIEQGNSSKSREIVQQAMGRARATLVDARKVIEDLRTDLVDTHSLTEIITIEVERFKKATGIPCTLDLDLPVPISEVLADHIFRIITEALENIIRHAQARSVKLKLSLDDNLIKMKIQDTGVGFDQKAEGTRKGHYGLLGMQERARLAGGRLTIQSEEGAGTQIQATFPLEVNSGDSVK